MGAGAIKQLPPTVDEATQRRLGGACFDREIYKDLPDPNAVPRERVLAEVERRGLDGRGVIFWRNLRHFFTVRNVLDKAWAAVPSREAVENGIEACDRVKGDDGAFDGAFRQQSLAGEPVKDLDELYAAAAPALPAFTRVLTAATKGLPADRMGVAPLKARTRAAAKAAEDYGRRDPGPPEAWLFDVVRGKAVCETGDEILAVWDALRAAPGVEVVRVKNRCATPKFNGYRDFLINLRVRVASKSDEMRTPARATACVATGARRRTTTGHVVTTIVTPRPDGRGQTTSFAASNPLLALDALIASDAATTPKTPRRLAAGDRGGGAWHVCELQLHIKPITDAEKGLHSHVAYEFFRSYFGGNDAAVAQRLGVLLAFGEAAASPKDMVDKALAPGSTADVAALREIVKLMQMLSELELEGRLKSAIVDKQKAAHGDGSSDYAIALNNRAQLLQNQGKLDEATPLMRQALAIWKKVFGEEHPKVALGLNNLAMLLYDQGKLDEAAPLFEEALAISKKVHGEEHPLVATDLNNLAQLLQAQGKLDEAAPLMRQALAIYKKALGEEHPKVALGLNNLAMLLNAQGKYDEALPLYKESLAIKKKVHGEEHPSVATGLNNLATLLKAQGKLDEAAPLFEEALAIDKKVHGEEHPSVAIGLDNLASLLRQMGKLDEAAPLCREALAVFKKVHGEEHPSVATCLWNLAALVVQQGDRAEAERLWRQALAVNEKALGGDHPTTVQCREWGAAL